MTVAHSSLRNPPARDDEGTRLPPFNSRENDFDPEPYVSGPPHGPYRRHATPGPGRRLHRRLWLEPTSDGAPWFDPETGTRHATPVNPDTGLPAPELMQDGGYLWCPRDTRRNRILALTRADYAWTAGNRREVVDSMLEALTVWDATLDPGLFGFTPTSFELRAAFRVLTRLSTIYANATESAPTADSGPPPELEQLVAALPDEIAASLVTTNDLDDGAREYFVHDGALFVNLYTANAPLGDDGIPVPDAVYRVDITLVPKTGGLDAGWEYGYTSKWGVHARPTIADAQQAAQTLRGSIAEGRESGDLDYHGLIVRRRPAASAGEWEPVALVGHRP